MAASFPAPISGSSPDEPLYLSLLGGFVLRRGAEVLPPLGQTKSEHLLAYLALNAHRNLARELLAGMFWPEAEAAAALTCLRSALRPLRRVLEPHASSPDAEGGGRILVTTRVKIRLALPPGSSIDAREFERLAEEGHRPALPREKRIALLEEAVALYRGPLLPECSVEWCETLRVRLAWLYDACLRGLAAGCREGGQYARAVQWARMALTVNPAEEDFHREVMHSLFLMGDRSGALLQFEECRRVLSQQGLTPSPETLELYERIRRSRVAKPPRERAPVPPYLDLAGPLTGRDEECERLWQLWDQAVSGWGQWALLSGEPGIGKSRLGRELLQRVEAEGGLAVYCQGYLEGALLYQPVIDAAKRLLDLAGRRRLDLAAPPVLAQVARLVPELRERFPDLPPPGPLDQEVELFDGLSRFFLGLARQRPLCLFIDDLHWVDDATLRFLQYLCRQAAETPVLLLGAFRDEEAREHPILVGWTRTADARLPSGRLRLPRLSEEALAQLLDHLAGGRLLSGLARRLHEETEGNPLFFLQTIRTLFETGLLIRDEQGAWHPGPGREPEEAAPPLDRLPLPPTVRQVIRERLERLDEPERRLLEAAAVLGQPAEFGTLCRTAGQNARGALPAVERLLAAGLLRAESDGRLRLGHDRFREVIYQDLSLPRRQALHLRAGKALEKSLGSRAETRAADLARHFLESRHPQVMRLAVRYLAAAGAAARELSAPAEAVRHLETALELLDGLPEDLPHLELRGQVAWDLCRAHRALSQPDRGEAVLEAYIQRCQSARYPAGEVRGCSWLAAFLLLAHAVQADDPRTTRVEVLLRRAISLSQQHRLTDWIAQPRLDLAFLYWTQRRNLAAQEQLVGEVIRELDRVGRRQAQEAWTMWIRIHAAHERWQEARDAFTLALASGGLYPQYFNHLLAEWEERLEREGRREEFVSLCREWQAQARAAGNDDLPRQWFLETAEPARTRGRPRVDIPFAQGGLPPEVAWTDPVRVGVPDLHRGKPLVFTPRHGPNLYPPSNLNAPRLMFPVEGDFVAETRVEIGAAGEVAAGLLLWRSDQDFLRLERLRSAVHGDGVHVEACLSGHYGCLGRGRLLPRAVWLRLERIGPAVRGLCSVDHEQWWACGSAEFRGEGPLKVGLACVAFAPGATAAFERFTVWAAKGQ